MAKDITDIKDMTVEEMEETLPIAEYDESLGEVLELTKDEKKRFQEKKYFWKLDGKPVRGISNRDLLEFIDSGDIYEEKGKEEDYIDDRNQ